VASAGEGFGGRRRGVTANREGVPENRKKAAELKSGRLRNEIATALVYLPIIFACEADKGSLLREGHTKKGPLFNLTCGTRRTSELETETTEGGCLTEKFFQGTRCRRHVKAEFPKGYCSVPT